MFQMTEEMNFTSYLQHLFLANNRSTYTELNSLHKIKGNACNFSMKLSTSPVTKSSELGIGLPKILNVHALWASTYLQWGL